MREIKFMAWHEEKKILREVLEISFSGGYVILAGFGSFGEIEAPKKDVELMEYTGIKDIHNNRVFEGDIVKITPAYGHKTYIGEVMYYEGNACYLVKTTEEYYFTFMSYDIKSVEVLGNIYQNKELMK